MDKSMCGIKEEEFVCRPTLSRKLEQQLNSLLRVIEDSLPRMSERQNMSVLVVVNLPKSCKLKKTYSPVGQIDKKSSVSVWLDVEAKPCLLSRGCCVFQMHGACMKNCKWRG